MRTNILPALAALLALSITPSPPATGSLAHHPAETRVPSPRELTTLAQVPVGQADGNIEQGDPESGDQRSGDPESGDPESGDPAYGDQGIDLLEGSGTEEGAAGPDSLID